MMMSKRTLAGLAALVVWGVNKALTLYGMPHLAPSLVWGMTMAVMGLAAYLTTKPATTGNKATQVVVAILALAGAIGVQLVDTATIPAAPAVPVVEAAPAPQPAAPVAPLAPPVVDLDATPLTPDGTSDDVAKGRDDAE